MTDFNYKKYSLEKLEEWMHDCMSSGEASPQEIYGTLKKVVEEEYYYYKDGASRTNELLALLNGEGKGHIQAYDDYITFNTDPAGNQVDFLNLGVGNTAYSHTSCEVGDMSDYCNNSWNDFWEEDTIKEDKVVKWILPAELDSSGEYFITLPDDLLEAANLNPGDVVEWVDRNDGTFILRKPNVIETNS